MVKVLLKDSTEMLKLSKKQIEEILQIRWLDNLEFQDRQVMRKVQLSSQKEVSRKELDIRKSWFAVYFRKEITEGVLPEISIRWINEEIGFGVFAEKDFPIGSYIGEYTGTVRKRKRFQDQSNDYCFEYAIGNWFYNPYVIDAMDQGNFTRYINHSLKPNLEPLSVYVGETMHIVLVSLRSINRGEQLCYHYGDGFWKKKKGLFRSI